MEDAPIPLRTPEVNEDFKENTKTIILDTDQIEIYQIDFIIKEKEILIKFYNTSDNSNKNYSYELTLNEIKSSTPFNNLRTFLSKINRDNCRIIKKDDDIELEVKFNQKNILTLKLVEEINLKDVIKELQILKKENKWLKEKVQSLENENTIYQKKMALNYFYNSFDINAYKLEDVFQTLNSTIIRNREDLGLINQGIKHLFNKNIVSFLIKYRSNNEEPDITNIKNQFDNLEYFLIVILTKDRKRFGAFGHNKNQINNQQYFYMDNMNNNNMYNNNMNMNNNGNNRAMNNGNNMMNQFGIQKNNGFNNNNMGNNNNMMNKYQNVADNNIFNSISSFNEYYTFSLDNSKIYYSDQENINNFPNFSIIYDFNRQCLYGNETNNNNSSNLVQSYQTINFGTQNNFNNSFKLSGKAQFNVNCFELYEVQIGNQYN